ncbi:MAG: hypothetical protein ACFWUC_07545 [Oscillospiraceae bacterium]
MEIKYGNNSNLPEKIEVPRFDLNDYNFNISPAFTKEMEQIEANLQEAAKERSRIIEEHIQREKERTEGIKKISELIKMLAKSTASNDKLSKRMFWLTVATVGLAVVQIVIAIISLVYR